MVARVNLLDSQTDRALQSTPGADTAERRRHRRYPVALKVLVVHEDVREHTVSRDLSIGGMSLAADNSFPLGSSVELLFEIPGDPTIHTARATVRWSDPGHAVGVQFDAPRAWLVFSLLQYFKTL
jgi:hypothetical protein